MRSIVPLLAVACPVLAQIPVPAQSQLQTVRAAMQASLAKQRASVLRQIGSPQMAAVKVAAPVPVAPRFSCPPVTAPALSKMIDHAARDNGLEPSVIREVARQESGFRPCAVSSKGAEGLMQLMPATQATLNVRNPFDPAESLAAGARLLRQLLDRYNGDLQLALSAYNAGPGRVDRTMSIPPIAETRDYVATILDRLRSIRAPAVE